MENGKRVVNTETNYSKPAKKTYKLKRRHPRRMSLPMTAVGFYELPIKMPDIHQIA